MAKVTSRAWTVFAVGAFAYFIAVTHRTALGVAGVEALDRFDVGATGLALLSVAQIATYAAMQVPAGKLLDRFGARTVMVAGAALMGIAQTVMAFSDDYTLAVVARVLLGAGDAPIFISACRLVARHFPAKRAPLMVQVTALIGQAGQLATAIPVAWVLADLGWEPTFAGLGALGFLAAIAIFFTVSPSRLADASLTTTEDVAGGAASQSQAEHTESGISRAGVWLGFWTHFTALFSANTIALLWGVPFFTGAQGLSKAEASALLTVLTVTKFVAGPLVGTFTARHPLRRSWAVLAFAGLTALAWAALLIPDGARPMWQLVLFTVAIAIGGPVSLVGVDFARTFAAPARLGSATGLANMGGFVSTIIAVGLVGVVLEVTSSGTDYSLDAYRLAFASLALPWALGVVAIVLTRRKARADWATAGVVVPPLRRAVLTRVLLKRRAQR